MTAYTYDAADRLTDLVHKTSGGTVRASYGYTLDKASRLTSETRTWGGGTTDTLAYTYTDDDQLTGVTHTNGSFANETFAYDANGNRNTTGYVTTPGNRTTSDGTHTYAYDDEGNLTSKTVIASGDQTLYTWDHRNRLTAVDSVVGGVTTRIATYTYDALDRRIGVVAGGASRWTLYDGDAAILDFDGSGNETARYLQGAVVDEILARETGVGSAVAWYLPDRLGTIRDIAENAGAVIDHVDYTVYGEVEGESSPANGDRWKFTGREYDAETDLYYYRARYYYAALGRFVSGDPIGFDGGDSNLFRYVNNQPIGFVNPWGLQLSQGPEDEAIAGPGTLSAGRTPRQTPGGGTTPTNEARKQSKEGIDQLGRDLRNAVIEKAITKGAGGLIGGIGGARKARKAGTPIRGYPVIIPCDFRYLNGTAGLLRSSFKSLSIR